MSATRTRRALLSCGCVLAVYLTAACQGTSARRGKLQELPVQLGHANPPSPSPRPSPPPTATPDCSEPSAEVVSYSLEEPTNNDGRTITSQIKTGCRAAVDVTLSVRWLDGANRSDEMRAFVTLRRILPGETRIFREVAPGGRGATRAQLAVEVTAFRRR